MITVVLLKTIDKKITKRGTTKHNKNMKSTYPYPKNDVLKTSKSQRYNNYYGLSKSSVASRTLRVIRTRAFLDPFGPKMVSKGCVFENHENRKRNQNPTFWKSSALGPSKNGPGERF